MSKLFSALTSCLPIWRFMPSPLSHQWRLLVLAAMTFLSAPAAKAVAPNVLTTNPGFETSIGYPAGPGTTTAAGWDFNWLVADAGGGNSVKTNRNNAYNSSPGHGGSYGCGISASSNFWFETTSASRPTVTPNRTYTLSFWYFYSMPNMQVGIRWYDIGNNLIRTDTNDFSTTYYAAWTQFFVTATAPANAAKASAYVVGVGNNAYSSGQGKFVSSYLEFDDFYLSTNQPPVVNAGPTQTIPVGGTVTLAGSGTDPNGDTLTYSWAQVSGPSTVTFTDATKTNTTASGFTAFGSYVLRLSVSDGQYISVSTVTINTSGNLLGNDAGFELCGGLYPSALTTNFTDYSMPGWVEYWATNDSGIHTNPVQNNAYAAQPAQEGTNAWGISATGPYWLETATNSRAIVQPGVAYALSFWMKYAMAYQVEGIRWYNAAGTLVGQTTNSLYANSLGGSWAQFFITGTAPAGAATASAYFYGGGNITFSKGQNKYVPGYVELDNFALRTNLPPVVSAGAQQAGFTNRYTLAGSATSPSGATLTNTWSLVSGPGTATFANSNSLNSTVTFSTPGIYILNLASSDPYYTVSSQVSINYIGNFYGNLLGNNYGFEDPNSPIYIESTGQTDTSMPGWVVRFTVATVNPVSGNNVGLQSTTGVTGPFDGTNSLYIDCYAGGYITLETAPQSRAYIAQPGQVYQLQFAQGSSGSDATVGIEWFDANGNFISSNVAPPSASASYPNFTSAYKKYVAPTNAVWAGVYYYMDGGFVNVDNFSIFRQTNNEPPVVYAGPEITRPINAPFVLAGLASDGDPLDVLLTTWSQVSGPGTVSFANPNLPRTGVSFSSVGDYVLRLTANDQTGIAGHIVTSDVLVHVVNPSGERILVFCGQSNMEGHGTPNTLSSVPPYLTTNIPNIYGFYANEMDVIGGSPETQGESIYTSIEPFWASVKTNVNVVAGYYTNVPIAGGTYQPYSFWKNSWIGYTRTSPSDGSRRPFTFTKGGTNLTYWATGLNPGEPWANANLFSSGEDVKEYGPELTVAWALHTNRPNETFYIVKYAPGGTSLVQDWNPSNVNGRYNAMKQWVETAMQERPGSQIAGFFWLQGESDASSGVTYYANLTNLIANVRQDFGVTNLPFVIAKIHPGNPQDPGPNQALWTNSNYGIQYYGSTNGVNNVRLADDQAAATLSAVRSVETSDLGPLLMYEWLQASVVNKSLSGLAANAAVHWNTVTNAKWAPIHFGPADIQTIGTRMGQAWLSLVAPYTNYTLAVSQSVPVTLLSGPVSFTGAVQTWGAPATNATGTIIFSTGSGPFSTNAVSGGIASSAAISSLALGNSTITAAYSGDANYPAMTNTLIHQVIVKGADYYINPTTGNDTNVGTNWGTPLQHIAAGIAKAAPGSVIHLQPGATFNENLAITNSGVAGVPIVVTGDDPTNRAILFQASAASDGVFIYNQGWITLQNLIVTGHGAGATTKFGVEAYADHGQYAGLTFSNVTVAGFYRGFVLGGWAAPGYGFNTVSLLSCQASNNLDAGGLTYGYALGALSNIVVQGCTFNNNAGDPNLNKNSGNGLYLSAVMNGLIDHCVARDNGGAGTNIGGPAGLWCSGSQRITIQYCESYRNLAQQRDGDGFDLDIGVTDSTIQYCYAHDNVGAGFLLNSDGNTIWNNNVVRYCISENDGISTNQYGSLEIFCPAGPISMANCQIYNNTFFNKLDSAVNFTGNNLTGVFLRNNLLVVTNGNALVSGAPGSSQALFQGNDYWSSGGAFNVSGYSSLAAWRAAGQETVNGTNTGFNVDPKLKNPGNGGTIGNAYSLSGMTAYQLQTNSPMINVGLNLSALFNVNPGLSDFYGVTISQNTNYDVGAAEWLAIVNIATTTTVTTSTNPSTFGQSVTFTALITPASGVVVPTGSVQFKVDGAPLGSPVDVTNSVGTNGIATLTTSGIAATGSPHTIAAEFVGTGNFLNSTNTLAGGQTVNYAPPTISGSTSLAGGGFQMTFSGPAGQTYQVLSSTNMALPLASWTPVASGTFAGSAVTYTNAAPTDAQRFYRVKSP
jgi:Carbohydrate esterase, sialic acid-specific acetylesterase/Bacterial Ig-like domain (group 3)